MPGGSNTESMALSPEDIAALRAHKQQVDADIEEGRFKPGERRCVTLPSRCRHYLAHPDPAPVPRRPWWARIFSKRL